MKIAIPFLLICCAGLGLPTHAQDAAVLTWGRFEAETEAGAWTPLSCSFACAEKFATEGKFSGRIHFRRYAGEKGEDQWPRVTAFSDRVPYPTDWTRWAALAFDLATDAPQGARVSLEIRGTRGKNGWYTPYSLPPGAVQHIVVPLSEVAGGTPLAQVAEVLFFTSRPEADFDVYVDNVRLLSPESLAMQRAVDAAGAAHAMLWRGNPGRRAHQADLDALRKAVLATERSLAEAKAITTRARDLERTLAGLRIRPLRAFDFGPAGSPLRQGFTAATARTLLDAQAGFGWRRTEGLQEHLSPAQRDAVDSYYMGRKTPPPVYLNDLDQDLVGGAAPAEFVVRVPGGEYTLWLLAGAPSGYESGVNRFSVDAGAGARRIGLPQHHIFESLFLPAKAGAEGLRVRFTPETGFVVNALALFPRTELRRARREFAGPVDQEIFRLPPEMWSAWKPVTHAPEKPAPAPNAEERRRGCVLFTRPFVENIYPDSQPQASERFRQLEAFATPGEYEPFTFALHPLREMEDVSITVGGLRGPRGAAIPAGRVDARQVRCWPVRTDYGAVGTYKSVPEVLDPVAPTDLDAGACHRFWITVHVPENTPAGLYQGEAVVRAGGARVAGVPLRLEVLPFRLLRDPAKSFGNYYYSPLDRIPANGGPAVRAAILRRAEAEAADMQAHGMNTLQMGGIGARKVNGQWEAAIALDERIAFLRRFGLWGQAPGVMMNAFWAGDIYRETAGESWRKHLVGAKMPPQAYYDAVTRVIAQVEKERLARGWPDFYYYPIDEATTEAIPLLAKTLAAIKQVPTAKTYATQVFEHPESRPLDDVLDVWCSGAFCSDLAAVEAMRAKGRIFWCYPNFVACSRGVPNSARMTYGFGLWRMGYSCLIPWHYQAPASGSNPFCDFDGLYGDWCMAYPGPDGPIPTQRWEGVREGIDDGRYLYTLEARIAGAKQRGTDAVAVAAGEALLKEIRTAVPVQSQYGQEGPWHGADYARWRRRLADAILRFEVGEH